MSAPAERLTNALSDRYTIEREVGRGGMATVFLAHDVRHDRRVALKVLDPELAAVLGADRFLAEIKVTANLQHPNLLPLFDSGIADGLLYYVMPFVEGESLRARLDRERQLPVEDVLRITSAVANALDYAHQHQVIHRDLKPENILLQHGQPVVADFGIALAVSNAGGTRITQTGLSLGTPHYMSPEQATGDKVIDARTDVYSLACMVYEMLVGEPPYSGPSTQAIIARLLTETPRRVRTLRATVPEAADAAVARALEKLPADRFASAGEFARALQGSSAHGATDHAMRPAPASVATRGWRAHTVRAAPYVALVATLGVLAWREWSRATPQAVAPVRFTIETPRGLPLLAAATVTISPDGGSIAYVTAEQPSRVAVRRLDQLRDVSVPGTEGALWVRFLAGGRHLMVGFPSRIDRVPIDGGTATTIASGVGLWGSPAASGQVVLGFSSTTGLSTVSEAGGPLRPLSRPDTLAGETGQRGPIVLEDGRTVLYVSFATANTSRIGVADLTGGPNTILPLSGITCVLGFVQGHIIYVSIDGTLMAVPADLKRRSIVGDPLELDRHIAINYSGTGCNAALARNGTLAYASRSEAVTPVLVSASGSVRTIDSIPRTYRTPRFSPDGRRVAFTVTDRSSTDIYLYELSTGTSTRLTNDGLSDRPEWSLDGRRLIYRSSRDLATPLWQRSVDGSSQAEEVKGAPPRTHHGMFMPDGRLIARTFSQGGRTEIYVASLAGETKPRLLVTPTQGFALAPSVSPDGKWLAYDADETGRFEIYVLRIDGNGARYRVSAAGGMEPFWSRDGRRLFYRFANRLFAATLTLRAQEGASNDPEVTVVQRDLVLDPPYRWQDDVVQRSYDLTPDGKEFLILRESDEPTRLVVVLNWASEFRERLAAQRAQSTKGR